MGNTGVGVKGNTGGIQNPLARKKWHWARRVCELSKGDVWSCAMKGRGAHAEQRELFSY